MFMLFLCRNLLGKNGYFWCWRLCRSTFCPSKNYSSGIIRRIDKELGWKAESTMALMLIKSYQLPALQLTTSSLTPRYKGLRWEKRHFVFKARVSALDKHTHVVSTQKLWHSARSSYKMFLWCPDSSSRNYNRKQLLWLWECSCSSLCTTMLYCLLLWWWWCLHWINLFPLETSILLLLVFLWRGYCVDQG